MTTPRDPGRDLRLERLGDRDGLRPAHHAEAAHVASPLAEASSDQLRAAYEALIDAVFTGPGAAEWLFGLRMRVAALIEAMDSEAAPRSAAPRGAIQAAPRKD